ncbi:hypothetical protein [Pedobacter sp. Hv1]|uniref:hypothetical protein n=1 Tax=Pedobacter sp. Hv1 TaxID=1740090 RepID=UPI0006D88A96|nr:hypothetical protein [Pedobacter sp. Hv1]KQC01789.1 hypothetical protein AQF98_05325 [Pedobacter sp. Hv1]
MKKKLTTISVMDMLALMVPVNGIKQDAFLVWMYTKGSSGNKLRYPKYNWITELNFLATKRG